MGTPLLDFTNVGMQSALRAFPGFPAKATAETTRLAPRGSVKLALGPGDLVSIETLDAQLAVAAFSPSGAPALPDLGVAPDTVDSALATDRAIFSAWCERMGLAPTGHPVAMLSQSDGLVLKSSTNCTLWIFRPAQADDVVAGFDDGGAKISVSRAEATATLPDPLGHVINEFTVRRGTAQAYRLAKGQSVQIIDLEGQQCSDFMAFDARGLDVGDARMIDSTATRSMVRQPYPRPGLLDKFFDAETRPMLQVLQDTCGRHDTFGLACTARSYEDRGFPGHVNCSDNISAALAPHGVQARPAWPAINFFWNTWVDPASGHILTEESHSRPGDYIVMQAKSDLVCVSTACPDDIDPINGWNPTDIHVRIYGPDTRIQRAVAYRVKEDSPMTISRESAFHPRIAALTHDLAPVRDLWMPTSFPSVGTLGEYWACRERVTLQDMSSLRKVDIVGPDAERLLQRVMTRDISRLAQWRGTYALVCDETGGVIDDGTLFRLGPQLFRWCSGSEESARWLETTAIREGLQVRVHQMSDTLANVSLQGPKARDVLSRLVFTQPHVPALGQLKWFGVTIGRLHDREGVPFMLSRTGYTGELGYELFCTQDAALPIWDALMEAGERDGIAPMGGAALEIIRIEAGLASAGAEFAPGHDALEAGLGFAVDQRKADFIGKAALERNGGAVRRRLMGLLFTGDDVPNAGAGVFTGERQIGEVTSATRSPILGHGIAMARLAVEYAEAGTELEVGMMDGHMKRLPARVAEIPFVDPQRTRARA